MGNQQTNSSNQTKTISHNFANYNQSKNSNNTKNSSSKQTYIWQSQFELNSKNSRTGVINLSDRQTEQLYLCRKISLIDGKQVQNMERLIDIKLSLFSPYVVKLQKVKKQQSSYTKNSKCLDFGNKFKCQNIGNDPNNCYQYGSNYYVLFKQPKQTIKQQALNRKFNKSTFSEKQLQTLLQIGIKALMFLKQINHPHCNISSSSFFITDNHAILLSDPWMFSNKSKQYLQPYQIQILKNCFIYPSPQMLKQQQQQSQGNNNIIHQFKGYDLHASDLFTFGLVLLQVYFMQNMDFIYDKRFQRVNYQTIEQKLSLIKNIDLRKKLFIILDNEPKNRFMIYKHYQRKVPIQETFTKRPRQKFKRNIQRYNLATSEVTEWKNQFLEEDESGSGSGGGGGGRQGLNVSGGLIDQRRLIRQPINFQRMIVELEQNGQQSNQFRLYGGGQNTIKSNKYQQQQYQRQFNNEHQFKQQQYEQQQHQQGLNLSISRKIHQQYNVKYHNHQQNGSSRVTANHLNNNNSISQNANNAHTKNISLFTNNHNPNNNYFNSNISNSYSKATTIQNGINNNNNNSISSNNNNINNNNNNISSSTYSHQRAVSSNQDKNTMSTSADIHSPVNANYSNNTIKANQIKQNSLNTNIYKNTKNTHSQQNSNKMLGLVTPTMQNHYNNGFDYNNNKETHNITSNVNQTNHYSHQTTINKHKPQNYNENHNYTSGQFKNTINNNNKNSNSNRAQQQNHIRIENNSTAKPQSSPQRPKKQQQVFKLKQNILDQIQLAISKLTSKQTHQQSDQNDHVEDNTQHDYDPKYHSQKKVKSNKQSSLTIGGKYSNTTDKNKIRKTRKSSSSIHQSKHLRHNPLLSTINQRSEKTDSARSHNERHSSPRSRQSSRYYDFITTEQQENSDRRGSQPENMSNIHDYHLHQRHSQENSKTNSNSNGNGNSQSPTKIYTITYESGTIYEGQISQDKRNGQGIYYYLDNSRYEGEWLNNKMNGFGKLFYPSGKLAYEGQWLQDNFYGYGKVYNDQPQKVENSDKLSEIQRLNDVTDIVQSEWVVYEGYLKQYEKHGKGTLKLVNGEKFQGQFLNDRLHGRCKFIKNDGSVIEGVWKDNKLVKLIS